MSRVMSEATRSINGFQEPSRQQVQRGERSALEKSGKQIPKIPRSTPTGLKSLESQEESREKSLAAALLNVLLPRKYSSRPGKCLGSKTLKRGRLIVFSFNDVFCVGGGR